MAKKDYTKLPDLDSKIGQYYINRKVKKMNKTDAQLSAGFADRTHATRIEETKTYKELEKQFGYREEILQLITLKQIAEEQIKVAMQDKDLSSKNTAIRQLVDKVEPNAPQEDREERVLVVLKG
jgi:hypothetical protein